VRVSPFEDLLFWGLRRSKIRVTLVSLEKPKEIPLGELFQAFNMIQSVYKRRIQEDQCFSYNNLSLRAVAISAVLKYDQPLYSHAGYTDLYLSTSRLSICSINHQFFYLLNANLFFFGLYFRFLIMTSILNACKSMLPIPSTSRLFSTSHTSYAARKTARI
jgi:hypothetical protein